MRNRHAFPSRATTLAPSRISLKRGIVARLFCLLGLVLLAAPGWAEIQVPPSIEPGRKIEAKVIPTIPAGAEFQGNWLIPGCDTEAKGADGVLIWATSGTHSITFAGAWMQFEIVDIPQADGTVRKIKSVLAWGSVHETARFTVTGGAPDPGPDPPPPSPGERVAVILEETSQRTPAQAVLWDQLRRAYPVGKLLILDDDLSTAKKYADQCKLTQRPVLLVVTSTGQLVREVACPASVAEVQKEVSR
jgi:hypothetical protein